MFCETTKGLLTYGVCYGNEYKLITIIISVLIVFSIFTGREAIRRYRYSLIMRGAPLFQSGERKPKRGLESETHASRADEAEGLADLPAPVDMDGEGKPDIEAVGATPPRGEMANDRGVGAHAANAQRRVKRAAQALVDGTAPIADLNRYTDNFIFALLKYQPNPKSFGSGWAISCAAYIAIVAVGLTYVSDAALFFSHRDPTPISLFTIVVVAAFLGSYLFTVSTLIQDLWNFDLSPISFLRSCRQILVGVGLAGLIGAAMLPDPMGGFKVADLDNRIFVLVGFIVGFVPGFGERYIFAALRRLGAFTKDYDPDAFKVSLIKPLDCIDGIDHWSAYRLELHMIRDVQNLATANPVVLYAETPFDFQQVFDWVAQAQLATICSCESLRKLKSVGILSSLDLYGAMVSQGKEDHILQIGAILAEDMAVQKVPPINQAGNPLGREVVVDWIEHRLSSPHFWRLLELNLRIYEGIEFPFERPLLGRRTRPPEAG